MLLEVCHPNLFIIINPLFHFSRAHDLICFPIDDRCWNLNLIFNPASMTLILGFFGSADLQLGPNCSRLIRTNPFFVQTIKAHELEGTKPESILYGFHTPPPLDVEIAWIETHHTLVPTTYHKVEKAWLNG